MQNLNVDSHKQDPRSNRKRRTHPKIILQLVLILSFVAFWRRVVQIVEQLSNSARSPSAQKRAICRGGIQGARRFWQGRRSG